MQTLKFSRTSAFRFRLQAEQWVPTPRSTVFDFFSAAENLELLTPPTLRFQVLTPTPITMAEGLRIDYRLKLQGVPFRWRSHITEWDPPYAFTDVQERGPYLYWAHRHTFQPVRSGTLLRDTVDYAVPLGPLVHGWMVKPQLRRIFAYRGSVITERFGGPSPDGQHSSEAPGDGSRQSLRVPGTPFSTTKRGPISTAAPGRVTYGT